jgi:uncharacterized HhH-GPD family protein
MGGTLAVTGDTEADALVNDEPLALLIGMLLDQQVPMEWAFRGPATLRDRLGHLDPARIAAMDPEALVAVASARPAIHRYPRAMAVRVQALCEHVRAVHDGRAAAVWEGAADGPALLGAIRALPGYGDEKARILVAVLAKRFGVRPPGWEQAAGPFADDEPRTVADIDGPDALARVRAWKARQRATGRGKQDPAVPEGAA